MVTDCSLPVSRTHRYGGPSSLCPEFGRREGILTPIVRSTLMNCHICGMLYCSQGPFPFLVHVTLSAALGGGHHPATERRKARLSWGLISPGTGCRRVRGLRPSILCYNFSCTKSHCPIGQAHFWQINSHLKSHLSYSKNEGPCWHRT